ncbi:hypothetical protein GCM10025771_31020 [Niveibacterium umoris]|uniref:GNAT superfamily N-acetyltransferase n=1 Tax=Niveibacterium umoris TaxID=1193620 RepID=A0A840BEX9_9RHOO|nr:GNAT family N-acetyltransferase [Niveibacterium umoris]MBB4011705.1 GNAT superfamily N-acetyltransferase [Niveibacterium umoris]
MQATTAATTTYNIHAYPAHLIDAITLPHGERAVLRPVLPQDAALEQKFVAGLSQGARFNRFHGHLSELNERIAMQLTYIDYIHQMGFVVTLREGDDEIVIADACYVLNDDGDTAEFAIAVSDKWQGQGLGTQLIKALSDAARHSGARWLYGEVLASNSNMLALMVQCGFTVRPHPGDDTLVRVERSVNAPCRAHRNPRNTGLLAAISQALPQWLNLGPNAAPARVQQPALSQHPAFGRSYERQLLGPFI